MRKEFAGAAPQLRLTSSIGGGDTSFTVEGNFEAYPDGGNAPFVVVISRGLDNEEKILCSSRSGSTFTIQTRGYDGTGEFFQVIGQTVNHALDSITVDEANAHANTTSGNPHNVTAGQVGADPAGSAAAVGSSLSAHADDRSNPHDVTASQVGADPLGSADAVQVNLGTHTSNTTNPHNVTRAQIGAETAGAAAAVQQSLDSHESDTNNPHQTTYDQVGADPAGAAAGVQTNLDSHAAAQNPHNVTAAQTGASPSNHNHDTAYESNGAVADHEAAIDPHAQYATDTKVDSHVADSTNPHGVTAAQAGAAPSSHNNSHHSVNYATEAALNTLTGTVDGKLDKAGGELTGDIHIHSYSERASVVSGDVTISFAGPSLITHTGTGSPTLTWGDIPIETTVSRSVTIRFSGPPTSVSWPTGTRFAGGAAPEIAGETWVTAIATGGEVTVLVAGTEVA